jgi:hypothetical protein
MASPFSGRAGRLAGMWAATQAQQDAAEMQRAIEAGRAESLAALGRGREGSLAFLGQGIDAARPQYQGAIDRFNPYVQDGRAADAIYQGSLGLGGPAARDSAVAAFRAGPGYQFRVDQASDAVARRQSALGALGSGNTMAAISDRAGNMADQEYGNWQDRVRGISDRGFAATGAQAGIQQGLANLEAQYGRDRAGVNTGFAGLESGVLQNATGQTLANIGQRSQTITGAGTGALMAGQTAAQNRLNFGMQLGSLGTQLLGGMMGGGGLGSLGSMSGGGAGPMGNMGVWSLFAGT